MLHHMQLGVFKHVVGSFKPLLGEKSQLASDITDIALLHERLFKRQADRDLPKTAFKKGIAVHSITV